jgi:hypothetical protein
MDRERSSRGRRAKGTVSVRDRENRAESGCCRPNPSFSGPLKVRNCANMRTFFDFSAETAKIEDCLAERSGFEPPVLILELLDDSSRQGFQNRSTSRPTNKRATFSMESLSTLLSAFRPALLHRLRQPLSALRGEAASSPSVRGGRRSGGLPF